MKILADFRDNLIAGLCLGAFLPIKLTAFRISLGQAALLMLAFLLASAGYHYALADGTRHFHLVGLSLLAAAMFVFIAAVVVTSLLVRAPTKALPLCIVLLAVSPIGWIVALGYELSLTSPAIQEAGAIWAFAVPVGLYLLTFVYWFGVVARSIRLVHGGRRWRTLGQTLAYGAIVWGAYFGLPQERIWYDDEDNLASGTLWNRIGADREMQLELAFTEGEKRKVREAWQLDVEAIYGAQPFLIADQLEELAPQRPGLVDLYFVGFAGYAYQDVFLSEVRQAQDLFDARFDTRQRSVALTNNLRSVWDDPLANLPNLRSTLSHLGETLDPEEDIVFLYLTSHGSSDHELSTDFGILMPNPISALDLKDALDESGIGWRVVVVSACYSGGFVDVLRDERTLVISSAAHDRTSFGCSDTNEFTYFGRAFIDQALRSETSFEEAFELARSHVAERESAMGYERSEPQIHVGDAIQARLLDLEYRLNQPGTTAANRLGQSGNEASN